MFPVNGTDRLFRVNEGQAHTTQEGWEPDKTPAMFTVIDEEHTGTQDDPIPAAKGMEYTYGLYYTDPEDGKLYRCERTGEQPGGKVTLQFLPHELVASSKISIGGSASMSRAMQSSCRCPAESPALVSVRGVS